jgi:hypothetical protein
MVRGKFAGISWIQTRAMSRPQFQPEQAKAVAEAFAEEKVDYVFIGKSAAVLMGFPAITQDVDVFPKKTPENGARIVAALRRIGFDIGNEIAAAIKRGKDFVQIKNGPFDVDLIFAPDGIENFAAAKSRSLNVDGFQVANLRDIIASKRASGREKDMIDLPLLERFREEFEKQNPAPLKSAADIAAKKQKNK